MGRFLSTVKYKLDFFLILLLSFFSFSSAWALSGTGTESDPYVISSAADWNTMAKNYAKTTSYRASSKYFELGADIDFTSTKFTPLGGFSISYGSTYTAEASSIGFAGHFNGNGHTLKNISTFASFKSTSTTGFCIGIFGSTKYGAEIKNLIVDNFVIENASAFSLLYDLGGIVGYSPGATISNCAVINSSFYGGNDNGGSGGIVGRLNGGTISNCVVDNVSIEKANACRLGGIVGIVPNPSEISGCYANVNLVGSLDAGGIVGALDYTTESSTIENCFSAGNIKMKSGCKNSSVGGFGGYMKLCTITNCGTSVAIYAYNSSTGDDYTPSYVGGFIGSDNGSVSMSYCYAGGTIKFYQQDSGITHTNAFCGGWFTPHVEPSNCFSGDSVIAADYVYSSTDASGASYAATVVANDTITTGCMAVKLNKLSGNTDWRAVSSFASGFSVPAAFATFTPSMPLHIAVMRGTITAADSIKFCTQDPVCGEVQTDFYITCKADMEQLATNLATNGSDWSVGKNFIVKNDIDEAVTTVIGTSSVPFAGTFEGGKHTINLSINSSASNVGMIGSAAKTAIIQNVFTRGSVSGQTTVGAVVGQAAEGSVISNCANSATVSGNNNVGGIVGYAFGSLSSLINVAQISGSDYVGGIAGGASSVSDALNAGTVSGNTSTTAGIVGQATGTVSSCVSVGFTLGNTICNGGTVTGCYYDSCMAVGSASANASAFSASTAMALAVGSGWTSTLGFYPYPSAFAATDVAKVASLPFYFLVGNKVNGVDLTFSQTASAGWSFSSSALSQEGDVFYPVAAGSVPFTVSSNNVSRVVPVVVVAPDKFSGGFGNVKSPFLISNYADFQELNSNMGNSWTKGKCFSVTNDINSTTSKPVDFVVGSSSMPFEGTLSTVDDKDYNIELNIQALNSVSPVGLFAAVKNASVAHLILSGSVAAGGSADYAGSLAGTVAGSTISYCSSSAFVSNANGAAAGLVGYFEGTLSYAINTGRITASSKAAGIAAAVVSSSTLTNCFNGGIIKGNEVGGIAVLSNSASGVSPTLDNCVNVGQLDGTSEMPVLYGTNSDAETNVTDIYYDNQMSLCAPSGVAAASATVASTALTVGGWVTGANVYPQPVSSDLATVAAAPVFLAATDSVDRVKYDFTVSVANGVSWTSKNGILSIDAAGKVSRLKAGVDTLVVSKGLYSKAVEVNVVCAWNEITKADTSVCNSFNGVSFSKDTSFVKSDTVSLPACDCGTITSRKVLVNVGAVIDTLACQSLLYEGKTYTSDTSIVNASCDKVNISIYPSAVAKDSSVVLPADKDSYSYTDTKNNVYTISRGENPIVDSLLCVDTISSKICECDSLYRSVLVSVPSSQSSVTIDGVQCNSYLYTKLDGTTVSIDTLDGLNYANKVNTVLYRDTLFNAAHEVSQIKLVTVKLYKTLFGTDTTAWVGTECDQIVYTTVNGVDTVFAGTDYLTDHYFNDTLISSSSYGCPSEVYLVKIRLKGISSTGSLVEYNTPETAKCDTVWFKAPGKSRATAYLDLDGSGFDEVSIYSNETATTCGTTTPYRIYVNHSVRTDTLLHGCDSLLYVTKTGKSLVLRNDTSFKDVLAGAVPVCHCDSIWNVTVKIHHSQILASAQLTACNNYFYSYLDKSRAGINIKSDTVITDTLYSVCPFCLKAGVACDSIIRTTPIHINHSTTDVAQDTVIFCQAIDAESEYYKYNGFSGADTTFFDTLSNQFGCDSVVERTLIIDQPVTIDSVIDACQSFDYTLYNGDIVTFSLPEDYTVVKVAHQIDYKLNVNTAYCDTVVNLTVRLHNYKKLAPVTHTVCDSTLHTRYDGSQLWVASSQTITDTLHSKMCNCDSLIRSDVYVVMHSFIQADAAVTDTLVGCGSVNYVRKSNAWNADTTIVFSPRGAGLRSYIGTDTMQSVYGCDSVIKFRVLIDAPHVLPDTQIYKVSVDESPFVFNHISYSVPTTATIRYSSALRDTFPSSTGGCDTVSNVKIQLFGCKIDTISKDSCGLVALSDIYGNKLTFTSDTLFTQVAQWSQCATCDSVRTTFKVRVHHATPTALIDTVYLTGCDTIHYAHINPKDMVSTVVTDFIYDYRLTYPRLTTIRYTNVEGCDSVETISYRLGKTTKHYYPTMDVCGLAVIRDSNNINHIFRADTVWNYRKVGVAACGCDSIDVYTIKVRALKHRDTTYVGCGFVMAPVPSDSIRGSFWDIPLRRFNSDTIYTLSNTDLCDTSVTVSVKVNPIYTHTTYLDSCSQVTYAGKVYKADTSFILRNETYLGCDSLDTVRIIVHPVVIHEDEINACGYTVWKGVAYTSSTVLSDTVRSSSCGCDSIINIHTINIVEPATENRTIDSCLHLTYAKIVPVSFNAFIGDSIYAPSASDSLYRSTSSFHIYGGTDAQGCDSIISLRLHVDNCYPFPVIINKYNWILVTNKNLINSDPLYGNIGKKVTAYQWFKSDELLLSATQSFYTIDRELSGCFHVEVTIDDSITLRSEEVCIDSVNAIRLNYDIYPDPVPLNTPVSIVCNQSVTNAALTVYNALGVKVYSATVSGTSIQIPGLKASGYYFVILATPDGESHSTKFLVE